MSLKEYEAAKEKNPDWDKVISRDLRTWIKLFIFDSTLTKREYAKVIEPITKKIEIFVSLIDDEEQKKKYRSDLTEYAQSVWKWAGDHLGRFTTHAVALSLAPSPTLRQIKILESQSAAVFDFGGIRPRTETTASNLRDTSYNTAASGRVFYKEMQKIIRNELAAFQALDPKPKYYANVNPRNIAEMTARFEQQKQEKEELKKRGIKLVYVPAHRNCSKRCQPYQGRVYSLDGTSGVVDGRRYIPIEDVSEKKTYTSKNTGRTYFCGLFAYNCRHKMEPYKEGMNIDKIPNDVIERTREIEAEQRKKEREIRAIREKEELYRILAKRTGSRDALEIAQELRKSAIDARKKYEAFSNKNGLAYYPQRLQVIAGENRYVRTTGKRDALAKAALKMKNEA